MKILGLIISFALMFGQGLSFTPPPVAAYINPGTGWTPLTSASAGGQVSFSPPPAALYCQISAGAQWTPCTSVSGGGSTTIASGTAVLNTALVASGACENVVTVVGTGIATTDTITVGFNGDPTAVTGYGASATGAVLTIYPYPTSGNFNVKVCNSTANSITPSALTLNWRVVR